MTDDGEPSFRFENLDVVRVARALVDGCEALARELPAERAHLADQLRRAATSVLLNVSEGAGEFRPAEKARIYRIALRSVPETISALRLARDHAGADVPRVVWDLAGREMEMLTRLIKNQERRKPK